MWNWILRMHFAHDKAVSFFSLFIFRFLSPHYYGKTQRIKECPSWVITWSHLFLCPTPTKARTKNCKKSIERNAYSTQWYILLQISSQLPAMCCSLIRGDTLRLMSFCCICVSLLLSLCIFYMPLSSFHSFLPPSPPLSCYQFFPRSLNVQCLQTVHSCLLNCFSSVKPLSCISCSPLCPMFYNQGEKQQLHFFSLT